MPRLRALLVATPLALVAACGGDDPLELPAGCQPLLAGSHCLAPFPSDFFRVADPSTATGYRVVTDGAASMTTTDGDDADITHAFTLDGFSQVPTLVATLPSEMAATGFPGLAQPAASLAATSNTLIIDAATGALIPHYADLDPRAQDLTRQAIVLHPLVGLAPRTRYVVALHGVVTPDGSPAPAAEGFRRLRDGEADGEPALAPLIARYDADIFPLIATAGVPRGELQLAWDFTVGSAEAPVADMLAVREATLAWLADHSPTITVDSVEDEADGHSWRTVRGTMTGPRFLDADQPGGRLVRDADGVVVQDGTATIAWLAKVPVTVRDQLAPGSVLAFGHGFFGNTDELDSGKTETIFDHVGAVGFGTPWVGMSSSDVGQVLRDLAGQPGAALFFGDRVHQAMANWIVLAAAIQGPMAALPELHRGTTPGEPGVAGDGANAGALLYDPAAVDYMGISQGHILGGTMLQLNPFIRRGVLQVGGAGFTHLMFRAKPFGPFLLVMQGVIEDPLDQQVFTATMQAGFDRFDPASYARFVGDAALTGTPAERALLLQLGLGDLSVPNLGGFLHARLLGVPVVTPSPAEPFGIATAATPHAGSGLALYDFGIDLSVYDRAEPAGVDNVVHEGLRQEATALDQIDRFVDTGVVEQTCDGVCDPS